MPNQSHSDELSDKSAEGDQGSPQSPEHINFLDDSSNSPPVRSRSSRTLEIDQTQSNTDEATESSKDKALIASFTLEFKARGDGGLHDQEVIVQYIEGNQEKRWVALDDESIYPWIIKQVNEAFEKLSESEQTITLSPRLEITQVRFLQPLSNSTSIVVNADNSSLRDVLHSHDSFVLEVDFKISGIDISGLTEKSLGYQIQGKFRNCIIGDNIPVGSNQLIHIAEEQNHYTARLPDIKLLPGPYQLQIVATLHHASVPPALFEIPILQVV